MSQIKTAEKFDELANELLSNWLEYSMMKRRMEELNLKIKNYMDDNNLDVYECQSGKLIIVYQTRTALDRDKIEDIEKYYTTTKVSMMFKSPNNIE